jgi:hypothetical protein
VLHASLRPNRALTADSLENCPLWAKRNKPQRRMRDLLSNFTRKQQIPVCRAGILVSDDLFLPKMDRSFKKWQWRL